MSKIVLHQNFVQICMRPTKQPVLIASITFIETDVHWPPKEFYYPFRQKTFNIKLFCVVAPQYFYETGTVCKNIWEDMGTNIHLGFIQ